GPGTRPDASRADRERALLRARRVPHARGGSRLRGAGRRGEGVKIRRIRLDGFGALRGEFAFDPGRVTVLLDDNERGKSTLLAAICAALYGLSNDKRSNKVLTPLERWKPWNGGSYRVEMEIDTGGERLWIKRDFDRETIEVWDEQGQDVTARFREGKDEYPVGHRLLGLDAAEFEKCAFVRQGGLDGGVPNDAKERGITAPPAR